MIVPIKMLSEVIIRDKTKLPVIQSIAEGSGIYGENIL